MSSAEAEAKKNAGNEKYKAADYYGAVDEYTAAIALEPRNPAYYGNRSAAYQMLSKFDKVIEDCEVALQLDPRFAKVFSRLAKAYMSKVKFTRPAHRSRGSVKHC